MQRTCGCFSQRATMTTSISATTRNSFRAPCYCLFSVNRYASAQCAPYEIVVLRGYEVRGYRPKQGLKPVRWEQLPPEWLKPPNPQEASDDP